MAATPHKRDPLAPLRLVLGELRGADPESAAIRALAALVADGSIGLLAELDGLLRRHATGAVTVEFKDGAALHCRAREERTHYRARGPRQEIID